MVRPLVSKLKVTTTGRSVVAAPATAACDLLGRGHGLDPEQIGAAGRERLGLLGERGRGLVHGHGTQRDDELARGAHRARDQHRPAGRVGNPARQPRRGAVELGDPVLGLMQFEPLAGAAEAVGEDDVGAGLDEAAMDRGDAVGLENVPELRAVARGEAQREQAGAHAAVRQQHGPCRQQRLEIRHD